MPEMRTWEVHLDSSVQVSLPSHLDIDRDDSALTLLVNAAAKQFIDRLKKPDELTFDYTEAVVNDDG